MKKFRYKIIFLLIITSVIDSTIIGILSMFNSKKIIKNQLNQKFMYKCINYSKEIGSTLNVMDSTLKELEYYTYHTFNMDEFIKDRNYLYKYKKELTPIIKEITEKKDLIKIGYIYFNPDLTGKANDICFIEENNGNAKRQREVPIDYYKSNLFNTNWYFDPIKSKDYTWTIIFNSSIKNNLKLISYTKALYKNNLLIGVIGVDCIFSDLEKELKNIKLNDNSFPVLFNNNVNFLFYNKDTNKENFILEDENNFKKIKTFIKNKDYGVFPIKKGRYKKFIYYSKISKPWNLIISVDEKDLFKDSYDSTYFIISTIITIIFISISLFIYGFKKTSNPLEEIYQYIKDINLGSNPKNISLNLLNRKDEIGNLAKELTHLKEKNKNLLKNYDFNLITIKALTNTIEAKDFYTKGHCKRVTQYSLIIGKELNLKEKDIQILKIGATLHDIGKIGISENILNKKGAFNDEEYNLIKKHPYIGYKITKDIYFSNVNSEINKIILQHHERIDGKGYPAGLKEKEIYYLSKIVSIADAYDAMTSSRPYRKTPLSKEKAIEELIKNKYTQFDGNIVDIFVEHLKTTNSNPTKIYTNNIKQ